MKVTFEKQIPKYNILYRKAKCINLLLDKNEIVTLQLTFVDSLDKAVIGHNWDKAQQIISKYAVLEERI